MGRFTYYRLAQYFGGGSVYHVVDKTKYGQEAHVKTFDTKTEALALIKKLNKKYKSYK